MEEIDRVEGAGKGRENEGSRGARERVSD